MNSDEQVLLTHVRTLEQEIGLPQRFLEHLLKEDDWSFVVKLHALFEAALSHLLTQTLGRPELADPLSRLPLGHGRFGKLAFVDALGLLEDPEREFFYALSIVRNTLVHDIKNATFSLERYLASLKPDDANRFAQAISCFTTDSRFDYGELKGVSVVEFARQNPKLAIWFSSLNAMGVVYVVKQLHVERKEHDRRMLEVFKYLQATVAASGVFGSFLKDQGAEKS